MKTTKSILSSIVLNCALIGALQLTGAPACLAQPDPNWLDHDRNRPQPPVVDAGHRQHAGASRQAAVGCHRAVRRQGPLAVGAAWTAARPSGLSGTATWNASRAAATSARVQNFGDCQLHVEWATPVPAHGEGQGRGNSGVFLGLDRYEIQVLDSYENKTYADGSAGAIYGQYPPLVNVCRPPGQWQTYDIVYTAPRFDAEGKLLSPVRLTVFHNGVLIQNNVQLTGPTSWLERAPYQAHPEKQPISLQDHGNPVRFRNIWVRELGKPGKKEVPPPPLTLPTALLDSYTGKYDRVEITREGDQLVARVGGVKFLLFAESPTKFFAKTTDVQIEFPGGARASPTA